MLATICWGNRKFYSLPSTFKAEARFRVKTKVPPEATNYEQFLPHISEAAEYIFFPWPWNSWVCCSAVDSVQGSCFNSQFWNEETSWKIVVSVHKLRIVVSVMVVAKLWVKTSIGGEVLTLNRPFCGCNDMQRQQEILFVAFNFQSWSSV